MSTKKPRKIHTQEFKAAARELNLYESQLYNWRASAETKSNTTSREAELAARSQDLNAN